MGVERAATMMAWVSLELNSAWPSWPTLLPVHSERYSVHAMRPPNDPVRLVRCAAEDVGALCRSQEYQDLAQLRFNFAGDLF